jgi:hypothetical protein
MSKISETGHAKNVANFDELVSFVSAYGTMYNPSRASISIAALQSLSNEAKTALSALNASLPILSNAIAARAVAFEPLKKTSTRIINALRAVETTSEVDDNAKTLVRKIQGTRARAKKTEVEKATLAAEGKEVKEISASQLSFDSQLENFDKLIKLLSSIPQYTPNEQDLSVNGLTSLYNDLLCKNAAVVKAGTIVSNARIARNIALYRADTGISDTAAAVKAYVKSLFGAGSAQFRQIAGVGIKAA